MAGEQKEPSMTSPQGGSGASVTPETSIVKLPTPKKTTPTKPALTVLALNTTVMTATPEIKMMSETAATAEASSVPETTGAPATGEHAILVNGQAPSKSTITLQKLSKLPILNTVTVRPKKNFKTGEKRMSREEGWVGTQRGEIAEKPCHRCSQGNNPFTLCCVVEGTNTIS